MKQQKLGLEQAERDDLDKCRMNIKILKKKCADLGWKMTSRYRKGPRKFYFTVNIPAKYRQEHFNFKSSDVVNVLREYFPEANVTSGGGGWTGSDANYTFAERRDRDALDRPTYEWKDWM